MCRYCAVTRGNWTEQDGNRRNGTGGPFATISRATRAKFAFRKGLSENCGEGFLLLYPCVHAVCPKNLGARTTSTNSTSKCCSSPTAIARPSSRSSVRSGRRFMRTVGEPSARARMRTMRRSRPWRRCSPKPPASARVRAPQRDGRPGSVSRYPRVGGSNPQLVPSLICTFSSHGKR
jgi:hypothetical protein